MQDLVDLLPDELAEFLPDIRPPPPSGLLPLKPTFPTVEQGVVRTASCIIPTGGSPGQPLHCVRRADVYGWPQKAPAPGEPFECRELIDLVEVRRRRIEVPEAWALSEHTLMLTAFTIKVRMAHSNRIA